MNILILTNAIKQPDDTDKGINNLVFEYAETWSNEGHNVVVINNENKFPLLFYLLPKFVVNFFKKHGNFTVPSLASRKPLSWESGGVKLFRIPIKKLIPHSGYSKKTYLLQFRKIVDCLNGIGFQPNVITGHWLEPQLALVNLLSEKFSCKSALVMHGLVDERIYRKYRDNFNKLDTLFFRSFVAQKQMISLFNYDKIRIETCYSGIPDRYISSANFPLKWKNEGVLHIIYVGRLVKYKRIDTTIIALKKAFEKTNSFIFTIIGDGPEKLNLQRLVDRLGLGSNVFFLDRMSRDYCLNEMRKADCFVMVSENEVFGLVYLEAMANGCITIASKNGGVDGIINDGINGFLCEQGNADELQAILRRINQMKKNEIEHIRNNAFNTICNYSNTHAANHYLDCIIKEK